MTYSFDIINSALNYHKKSKLSLRSVAEIFGISKSVFIQLDFKFTIKI